MVKYYQIPNDIVSRHEVRQVRKRCHGWTERKMFSEYMDAYKRGVNEYTTTKSFDEQKIELTYIAIYYILRQEFLRRLTPFVILRSNDYISLDNSNLLHRLDLCLNKGVESCQEETTNYINELMKRME